METCRQYLAAHEWNVERAIETALISDIDPPSPANESDRITTDDFPSAPPMPEANLDEPPTERPVTHSANPVLYVRRKYRLLLHLKLF